MKAGIGGLVKPKKVGDVKIGNTKYSIYFADKIFEDGLFNRIIKRSRVLGQIHKDNKIHKNNYISLDKNASNKRHIFYHEITHGLLYELSKTKRYRFTALKILSENEHFIDTFSKILEKTFRLKDIKWKQGDRLDGYKNY